MKYLLLVVFLLAALPAMADDSGWNPIGGTVIGEPPPPTSPPPIGPTPLGGTDIR